MKGESKGNVVVDLSYQFKYINAVVRIIPSKIGKNEETTKSLWLMRPQSAVRKKEKAGCL